MSGVGGSQKRYGNFPCQLEKQNNRDKYKKTLYSILVGHTVDSVEDRAILRGTGGGIVSCAVY